MISWMIYDRTYVTNLKNKNNIKDYIDKYSKCHIKRTNCGTTPLPNKFGTIYADIF